MFFPDSTQFWWKAVGRCGAAALSTNPKWRAETTWRWYFDIASTSPVPVAAERSVSSGEGWPADLRRSRPGAYLTWNRVSALRDSNVEPFIASTRHR